MWLFTKESYLAITMNKQNTDLLHVRARVKGDIEFYWPTAEIEYTPDADYLYRTNLPRTEVMNALAHHIVAIDYTSFKGSIEDRRRMPYITAIWEDTIEMQEACMEMEDEEF